MGFQIENGLGPHAMWGYTPATDLLQDTPSKSEVSRRWYLLRVKFSTSEIAVRRCYKHMDSKGAVQMTVHISQPSVLFISSGEHLDLPARGYWTPSSDNLHSKAARASHGQREQSLRSSSRSVLCLMACLLPFHSLCHLTLHSVSFLILLRGNVS